MTRLLEKLLNRLSKIGAVGIENTDDNLRDNEDYVRKVIKKKGAQKFEYASNYLRSDAGFILSLVEEYPDVLEFCKNDIYDRYVKDCFLVEEELMDKLVFVDLCYQKNNDTVLYFSEDIAQQYLKMVQNGEVVRGIYQGKEYEHQLISKEDDLYYYSIYQANF